jgi:hypothetical protein
MIWNGVVWNQVIGNVVQEIETETLTPAESA